MTFRFTGVMLLLAVAAVAQAAPEPAIIPRPQQISYQDGSFTLKADTGIDGDAAEDAWTRQMLGPATGYSFAAVPQAGSNFIRFEDLPTTQPTQAGEYQLSVTPDGVTIEGDAFYALQTLRQLLPPEIFGAKVVDGVEWTIPCVTIHDYPRFQWRGMMLDCSRHFFPKSEVERFIDLMAIHKMNVFHWHLTDDQGWRIQILKYPKLTDVGAWRKQTVVGHEGSNQYDGKPYGGFYRQDEIREIVKYASDRQIMIVPEIEMPGHSTAAVAAYPELGNTGKQVDVTQGWGVFYDTLNPQESTIQFYENVLDEVVGLFPGPYVHLGGDEVQTKQWDESAAAQARIKELGLKDSKGIQPYMLRRMSDFLHTKGKRVVGWEEILDDQLPADSVIMSWHGPKRAVTAAREGIDVVMAPEKQTYFDHYQSADHSAEPLAIGGGPVLLKTVYGYEPVPKALASDGWNHIIGAQGQLWSEYIPTSEHMEYMAFPRECAMAEALWSAKDGKDYGDFEERLAVHLKRLDEMGVKYRQTLAGE